MADVVICLYRLAEHAGIDLDAEVAAKYATNLERWWHRDGTGHGYHCKHPDPCKHCEHGSPEISTRRRVSADGLIATIDGGHVRVGRDKPRAKARRK